MTNYREILRLTSRGFSSRDIAKAVSCSKTTVLSIIKRAKEAEIPIPVPIDMTDDKLQKLLFPKSAFVSLRKQPDFEYIHKELKRPNLTLVLLWHEYCDECSLAQELPYMYSQFSNMYRNYLDKHNLVMRLDKKPGAAIEVDWAGSTAVITNPVTCEKIKAYIFVATLAMSRYTYVEAFLSMDTAAWITGHIHAFEFFGGSAKTLIPDNLKTGVTKTGKYETILNKTYSEMAKHYDTAVLPARVRKPRDKSAVEGEVGIISNRILAALRNHKFFTLSELNEAICEKLEGHNHAPFQKKEGGRYSIYLDEEKDWLIPLPLRRFELAEWKEATVGPSYHIALNKMNYSVPYEYAKERVSVRFTINTVEIYVDDQRIASHPRLHGTPGQYRTDEAHMPDSHRQYLEWDSKRFIRWAAEIGPNTLQVIQAVFDGLKIEQQGYKQCLGILNLSDKSTYKRKLLEQACEKALQRTHRPSYKMVSMIFKSEKKQSDTDIGQEEQNTTSGFTRGADYYGGN
jgi:transposase